MKWILRLIDRCFIVIGVVLFSQAPLYIQQYTQQLSGHTAELTFQVQQLQALAKDSHKSLAEYIQKFLQNIDMDFVRQGEFMQALAERQQNFYQALSSLQAATPFTRPLHFLANFNPEVGKATWAEFEYGLSFTLEGAIYAFVGGAIGYCIFFTMIALCRRIKSLFIRSKTIDPS